LIDSVPLWLPVAFFLVAFIYASGGFGGGTGYLAILTFTGLSHQSIPQIALACNIIVSAGGVWHFTKGGHMAMKKILPFFALAIPAAYFGGRLAVNAKVFYVVLGVSLLIAGIRMLIRFDTSESTRSTTISRDWLVGLPVGAGLGFLSGMVGIGGGIFLSPVLLLTGQTNAKQTAAAASLFILVNSLAGLGGQLMKGIYLNVMVLPLALAVLIGGQMGSRIGAYRMPGRRVQQVLAAIIIIVGLRLFWKAL
jgi:uncharacterized membrane protein YfcA